MRTLTLILLVAVLASMSSVVAVGAQDASPVATPAATCAPGTPGESAAVAEAYLGAWNDDHDFSVFEEVADPGIIHHWGQGRDTVGIADLTESAKALIVAFPNLALTYDEVIVAGDTVVIRWTAVGTQDGPFFEIEPTGITATWTGINIYRVSCGKVVETWGEVDGLGIRQQLGMSGSAATPQPQP